MKQSNEKKKDIFEQYLRFAAILLAIFCAVAILTSCTVPSQPLECTFWENATNKTYECCQHCKAWSQNVTGFYYVEEPQRSFCRCGK